MRSRALLILSFFIALPLRADDGAASIAAGGIIVMKREPRIAMAKETLTISPTRVLVDYDFHNDSDQNVTTEVAFPVPAFQLNWTERDPKDEGFDDFKLWVDGMPTPYTTEIRAFANKHDITALLRKLNVDPASFGHFVSLYDPKNSSEDPHSIDIDRLSKADRAQLIAAKAFPSEEDREPRWSIEKKYHWSQTFPAHAIVHIRHEYTPVLGNSSSTGYGFAGQSTTEQGVEELSTLCPTPALLNSLKKAGNSDEDLVGLFYVDFILTTANTWKTPIEDFTLIVERDPNPGYRVNLVSFCWDGPVTKLDPNHFSAHMDGLVPQKELRIGFIRSDFTRDQVKANKQWKAEHTPQ
jgi:hypothetical protein